MPTFGSLFAGIGGLDLGLERAGWTCRWQVERDPFRRAVLAKHWPHVARYGAIEQLNREQLERVDLICGGFPCQPVSLAGKQQAQADERWLWPEFARTLRALRPRLVLVENVPGLFVLGMGDVLRDMAASGYDAEWDCIPAAAVGALHLRWRVWIVGHRRDGGAPGALPDTEPHGVRHERERRGEQCAEPRAPEPRHDGAAQPLADPDSGRQQKLGLAEPGGQQGASGSEPHGRGPLRQQLDTAPELADADLPGLEVGRHRERLRKFAAAVGGRQWAVEPEVGRVAHGVPGGLAGWRRAGEGALSSARWRRAALEALGDAVVPQLAEWLGAQLIERLGKGA